MLTANGQMPSGISDPASTIGVWSAASRRRAVVRHHDGTTSESGPWVQVSRLGMPLINEVIIPLGQKDDWNHDFPQNDAEYVPHYQHPELAKLLPVLYPGVFPNLAGLAAERTDLEAILLTGIPSGIIPGFQNFTRAHAADQLRLNVAMPPSASPSPLGILGGDLAGFPNGRRLQDDIVAIELRAIAGATYPLVNKSYTPDGAAALLTQGIPAPADGWERRPLQGRVPVRGRSARRLRHARKLTSRPRGRVRAPSPDMTPRNTSTEPGGDMSHDHDHGHVHDHGDRHDHAHTHTADVDRHVTTGSRSCARSPWCSTSATASGR